MPSTRRPARRRRRTRRRRPFGATRRRQAAIVAGTLLGVIALAAVVGPGRPHGGTVRARHAGEDADRHVDDERHLDHASGGAGTLIDPDEAGPERPDRPTRTRCPASSSRVSPTDPGELFGCPGLATGTPPRFLMTVQEDPLALSGEAAGSWPVALEPMGSSRRRRRRGVAPGGCYPSWEFLRAGWTAAGRTFEARIGLAPDVSDAERAALERLREHDVRARRGRASLGRTVDRDRRRRALGADRRSEAEGLSADAPGGDLRNRASVFDAGTKHLQLLDHVFGTGAEAERVVFAAVPADVVRSSAPTPAPNRRDRGARRAGRDRRSLNAFVFEMPADRIVGFEAV